jgi:hypothetical protein
MVDVFTPEISLALPRVPDDRIEDRVRPVVQMVVPCQNQIDRELIEYGFENALKVRVHVPWTNTIAINRLANTPAGVFADAAGHEHGVVEVDDLPRTVGLRQIVAKPLDLDARVSLRESPVVAAESSDTKCAAPKSKE